MIKNLRCLGPIWERPISLTLDLQKTTPLHEIQAKRSSSPKFGSTKKHGSRCQIHGFHGAPQGVLQKCIFSKSSWGQGKLPTNATHYIMYWMVSSSFSFDACTPFCSSPSYVPRLHPVAPHLDIATPCRGRAQPCNASPDHASPSCMPDLPCWSHSQPHSTMVMPRQLFSQDLGPSQ